MKITKTIVQTTISAFILLGAILLILFPSDAIQLIAEIVVITLLVIGIRYLIYYAAIGRFMVGGRMIFYIGLIILDLSIFSVTLLYKSDRFILLYLIIMNAVYGVIQLLHALQGRKYSSKGWKIKMINGIINLTITLCCIIFIGSGNIVVYIYAAGLVHTALINLYSVFQKDEEPVVIQ